MRQLAPLFLLSILSVFALLSWANEADDVDEIGCRENPVTGAYQCAEGALKGREFVSKEEAADALDKLNSQKSIEKNEEQSMAQATSDQEPLRILAWNVEKLGTENFEYDRVANLLGENDIVALQEVRFGKNGETSLTVVTDLMARKLKQKICKAWFKTTSGIRAKHAFIWKDERIGFIESNGEIRENCPAIPQILNINGKVIDENTSYSATFYVKAKRRGFLFSTVNLASRPKNAEQTIPSLFKKIASQPWPAILLGDLKVPVKFKAFSEVRKLGFTPAVRTSGTNVWTKSLSVIRANKVDLYDRFPELSAAEIDRGVGRHFPVAAEISFSVEEADQFKAKMIQKPNREKSSLELSQPSEYESKVQKALDIHDDLEREVQLIK